MLSIIGALCREPFVSCAPDLTTQLCLTILGLKRFLFWPGPMS